MENLMTIGEVAKLLNIPESTLRFWQDKKIFTVAQGANSYRSYTVADLIAIAEIAFYRNIGMPVREMKDFSNFNLKDYDKILGNVKDTLQEKIELYTAMYNSVNLKSDHIKNIEKLKLVEFTYEKVPFNHVVEFHYSDRNKLIEYTKNPSLYVRCMDTDNLKQDVRGIITRQAAPHDTLLWQKKDDCDYAVFLIEEIASENYVNNIPEKLYAIRKKHQTGLLLANFLLSETRDGNRIDYLKGYVELPGYPVT